MLNTETAPLVTVGGFSIVDGIKQDLELLLNRPVRIRDIDGSETLGSIISIGKVLMEVTDLEDAGRIVRLRVDRIWSVDDPTEADKQTINV